MAVETTTRVAKDDTPCASAITLSVYDQSGSRCVKKTSRGSGGRLEQTLLDHIRMRFRKLRVDALYRSDASSTVWT